MKSKELQERRLLAAMSSPDAQRALAEEYPILSEPVHRAWCKVVWYGEKTGGKLVTFKAGNPYLPKEGKRDSGKLLTDEQREEQRLQASLSRTRRRIFEIAACNEWQWFFTGTLDGEKCDRNDLNKTFKAISQFIRDQRKKGYDIHYLIVPEEHKKGGWHFHGLIGGLPETALTELSSSDYIPKRVRDTIEGGTRVWTWTAYAQKFGYSTVTAVRDSYAVSAYVTKYITKEMVAESRKRGRGSHLYYCSQGLKEPVVLAESYPTGERLPDCDYENDYVQVRRIKTRGEAEAVIKNYSLAEYSETNYTPINIREEQENMDLQTKHIEEPEHTPEPIEERPNTIPSLVSATTRELLGELLKRADQETAQTEGAIAEAERVIRETLQPPEWQKAAMQGMEDVFGTG